MTSRKELEAFKDGVADAILEGYKSEWHPNIHYYKEGYDFGMAIYCKQLDLTDQNPHTKEKSNE